MNRKQIGTKDKIYVQVYPIDPVIFKDSILTNTTIPINFNDLLTKKRTMPFEKNCQIHIRIDSDRQIIVISPTWKIECEKSIFLYCCDTMIKISIQRSHAEINKLCLDAINQINWLRLQAIQYFLHSTLLDKSVLIKIVNGHSDYLNFLNNITLSEEQSKLFWRCLVLERASMILLFGVSLKSTFVYNIALNIIPVLQMVITIAKKMKNMEKVPQISHFMTSRLPEEEFQYDEIISSLQMTLQPFCKSDEEVRGDHFSNI